MSENYEVRLERIEILVEKIGQRVDSNAPAIQALSEDDNEAKRERAKLYQTMSNLAQSHANLALSQANLAQAHADNEKLLYQFMENLEEQQQQWKQRQDAFEERQNVMEEQQQQWKQRQDSLEEQQQRSIKTQADIAELLKFVINRQG